jgi:hypothetical protein
VYGIAWVTRRRWKRGRTRDEGRDQLLAGAEPVVNGRARDPGPRGDGGQAQRAGRRPLQLDAGGGYDAFGRRVDRGLAPPERISTRDLNNLNIQYD